MGFIRIIHQKHYDPDTRTFKSLAFKPSGGNGGISVIDEECIRDSGAPICKHIERYYKSVSGEPAVFWQIPDNTLPDNSRFIQQPSNTGDECHHNIVGVSTNEARRIFKQAQSNGLGIFKICSDTGEHRTLTEADASS